MLRIHNLARRYGEHTVFEGLSQTFGPGCYALTEEENTGKSTLLATVAGVAAADAGEVFIDGHPIGQQLALALARLAYVPEDCLTNPHLTGRGLLEQMAKTKNAPLDKATQELATRLDLDTHLDKRFEQMSTGTRRKMYLAAASIGQPAVVIADGPTNGLDAKSGAVLAQVFAEWARDRVVLFASYDDDFVKACGASTLSISDLQSATKGLGL